MNSDNPSFFVYPWRAVSNDNEKSGKPEIPEHSAEINDEEDEDDFLSGLITLY